MSGLRNQATNPPKLYKKLAYACELGKIYTPSISVPLQATISASRMMLLLILGPFDEPGPESPKALRIISWVACLSKVESLLLLLKIVMCEVLLGNMSTCICALSPSYFVSAHAFLEPLTNSKA
jgi:hypothetical protein